MALLGLSILWVAATGLIMAQPAGRAFGPEPSEVLGTNTVLPTYRALLIGIAAYSHWPQLPTARQDAENLEPLLRQEYGFSEVRTLYDADATRSGVLRELRRLVEDTRPTDALLIYFSGHGQYDRVLEKGYWVPVDAPANSNPEEVIADLIEDTSVKDLVARMRARHVLLVSDSCFSGALLDRSRDAELLSRRENTWYRRALAQPSRYCITSGAVETVPATSAFAAKFRQVLLYLPYPVFSASELAISVRREVAAVTTKHPVHGALRGPNDSLEGEFVFVRRSPLAVPPRDPLLTASKERPYENSLGMKFVPVPGTDVLFCIWETRVKDYAAYAGEASGVDRSWRGPQWGDVAVTPKDDCPVVEVSWDDAKAFCDWLTRKERTAGRLAAWQFYRLPTDLEWSAAVGLSDEPGSTASRRDYNTTKDVFPWGPQWPPPAGAGNYSDETARAAFGTNDTYITGYRDLHATTAPAGSFPANRHGLLDLGGNVQEWCEDAYDSEQKLRVIRDGAWVNDASGILRSSYRGAWGPSQRYPWLGFRCVLAGRSAP